MTQTNKFAQETVNNFCDMICSEDSLHITDSEFFQIIKEKTNDFNINIFKYLINDIRNYAVDFTFILYYIEPVQIYDNDGNPILGKYQKLQEVSIRNFFPGWNLVVDNLDDVLNMEFEENETLEQRIRKIKSTIPSAIYIKNTEPLFRFSGIAESEYKRVTESTTEPEPTLKGIKRPNNTHGQQFALLESLGIIDYLKREYNLPDTKMSELIANILNKDIQNTRTMLSLTGTKNQESNLPKNKDVVTDILTKTEVIKKD